MHFTRRRPTLPSSVTIASRWRRHGFRVLIVSAIAAALVCSRWAGPPDQSDDWARYHDRWFRVVSVVDGDTLDIAVPDGNKPVTRIRLWGVDAPETGRGRAPAMHFSREATAFAARTLTNRSVQIVLSPKRTRGKYGRLLAYVFLERGGRMFNEMLLEEGYAYADLRFDHHYHKRFQAIEKSARRASVGLWADVTLDKMPAWKQRFERAAAKPGG